MRGADPIAVAVMTCSIYHTLLSPWLVLFCFVSVSMTSVGCVWTPGTSTAPRQEDTSSKLQASL